MKNYFIILSCILILSACKAKSGDQSSKEVTINQSALVSVEISVKGMTCTGCESTIKTGVSEIPGVVGVTASFQEGKTTVRYDSTLTNIDNISKVINQRGYEVTGHGITD